MRTTIELDEDTAAAIARFREDTGLGVSAAINHLVLRGLEGPRTTSPFQQHTYPLGIKIDVSNVTAALERLEGPGFR